MKYTGKIISRMRDFLRVNNLFVLIYCYWYVIKFRCKRNWFDYIRIIIVLLVCNLLKILYLPAGAQGFQSRKRILSILDETFNFVPNFADLLWFRYHLAPPGLFESATFCLRDSSRELALQCHMNPFGACGLPTFGAWSNGRIAWNN